LLLSVALFLAVVFFDVSSQRRTPSRRARKEVLVSVYSLQVSATFARLDVGDYSVDAAIRREPPAHFRPGDPDRLRSLF
jgi:hypothetical protein